MSTPTLVPDPAIDSDVPPVVAVPEPTSPVVAGTTETRGRARRWAGRLLLGLGVVLALFLAYEFVFTGYYEARSQHSLLPEFQQRIAEGGGFDSLTAPVPSGPVALIQIPGHRRRPGGLRGQLPAGSQAGSGPPARLAAARRVRQLGDHGPPADVRRPVRQARPAEPGDLITTVTGLGKFTYKVDRVRVIVPGESDVIGPALHSDLTLVTSRAVGSTDRLAVISTLVGRPVGVPKRPPVAVGSDQQGTTGDISGLLATVLWAQVLILLVVVAGRLYRRWPRMAVYLMTTPPILMVLWLMFQSLDRYLPGTL